MESVDFFLGTRFQPPLVLSFYDGKAQLICKISENWGQKFVHSIRCGAKYSRKLKRSVGMVYTEKDDLESLVTGSIGLKGIASIDSQISAKSGVELQLSRSEEIEEEFTFESPKCGELVIALYQFRRIIELIYRDHRPFHKKEWSTTTTYWVDRVHDNSHPTLEIPECGCKADDNVIEDGKIYIDAGNVSMTTSFIEYADTIQIPKLDLEIDKSKLHQTVQFHRSKLPSYLLFLAGEVPEVIESRLSFKDAVIKDLNKNFADIAIGQIESLSMQQPEMVVEQLNRLGETYPQMPITLSASSLRGLLRNLIEQSIYDQLFAEKTEFDVVIKDAGAKKIDVIKVIRQLTSLGLGEAKTLAETSGGKILSKVSPEEAADAIRKLRAAGADAETE